MEEMGEKKLLVFDIEKCSIFASEIKFEKDRKIDTITNKPILRL